MNCCDDYGQCTRGADCPARSESTGLVTAYHTGFDRLDALLKALSYGAAVLSAICLVAAVIVTIGILGGLSR